MKKTLLTATLLASVLGTGVFAQGMDDAPIAGPMAGPMDAQMGGAMGLLPDFATLDADADGLVTPAEVEARAAARFATADSDASGGLSIAELVAMADAARLAAQTARMTEHLVRIDDNADGEVQATELQARLPQQEVVFDTFDTDNDGAISTAEFDAGMAQMAENRQARHQGDGPGRGGPGHDGPRGGHSFGGWDFWNRNNG